MCRVHSAMHSARGVQRRVESEVVPAVVPARRRRSSAVSAERRAHIQLQIDDTYEAREDEATHRCCAAAKTPRRDDT